jgi:hypothetical protein
MQYMLLIYEPEAAYEGPQGEATLQEVVAKHFALAAELGEQGVLQGGNGLQPTHTATTVITQGADKLVHDGPYAETREQLGGYYLVDVPDLDAALAIAKRIPGVDGTKIEVRPVMTE